jgi:preprotein translocase SecE subunit
VSKKTIFATIETIMNSILTYFKETQAELKEVSFPSVNVTITYTLLVISISVVVAAVLGGVDLGIHEILIKVLEK